MTEPIERVFGRQLAVASALAVIACVLTLSACGGGSEGATSTAVERGEPSAEFAGSGPNGKLAKAGKEASAEEREAASEVLEENLQARAAGDWESQCGSLAAGLIKGLEKTAAKGGSEKSCAAILEAAAKKAPEATLEDTMTEPIAALRVNGSRAFAFYHGAGGKDYVVPLQKEGGGWKVAAIATQEAP